MTAPLVHHECDRADASVRPSTGVPDRTGTGDATGFAMTARSFVALQRRAGNAAVAALVAQRAPAQARPTVTVQRNGDEAEEPAGCGFCIDPGPAGTQAHNQIQEKMGVLGVDSEVKVAAGGGRGSSGRLDLARWDDTGIEIGEIKPGHATGLAQGRSDLDFYKGVLEKTKNPLFQGKAVRMLGDPGPAPMVFENPGVALPMPQMLTTTNVNGVYGYKCTPPNSDYFTAGGQLKAGDKHVTPDVLKAKKDFFDSECIRKKLKRQATEEERVRITDRAGAKRLVKTALAMSLLQSRAFHVTQQLSLLSGEHQTRRDNAVKASVGGMLLGGPVAGPYAMAALYDLAAMPPLSIWDAAQTAADLCKTAKDLKTLAPALDQLENAMIAPRYQYLTYRGDNAAQPNTPAPAAGAQPRQGDAPPVPPPAPKPAAQADPAAPGKPADAGIDPLMIAALAGVVLLTFLILQPELGAAAVAGAVGTGTAETGLAAGTAEVLLDTAATAGEVLLEGAAEEVSTEVLVAGAGA